MTSHEEKRMFRLSKVKQAFDKAKQQGKTLDNERLIAQCSMMWGTSRRTMLEYIKIVELGS